MAYYSKVMSLKEITNHIYGRMNVISRTDRPNMFIKELNIYIDFLKNKLEETKGTLDKKQEKYFSTFSSNLNKGITYYNNLFGTVKDNFKEAKSTLLNDLELSKNKLQLLTSEIENSKKI